jgi:Fe-S cluster biogenesis protein NfuA/nitrite reductase/ring-hydroxylating ferredoxin subunit
LLSYIHRQGHIDLVLRAAHDPIINTFLQLYDFLPQDERTQVETALEVIRPYIHSHGGEVEVLGVEEGVVHLRLSGSCYGCAGSTMTLQRGIEAALQENFPGFRGIEVHDAAPQITHAAPGFIALDEIGPTPRREIRRPVFQELARLQDIPPGAMKVFEVDKIWVLVTNVGGEIYAVNNHCPGSAAPLHIGHFAPPIVVCPWHNEAWDIRTGKRSDGEKGPNLQVLPVAVNEGVIRVAVNTVAEPPLASAV